MAGHTGAGGVATRGREGIEEGRVKEGRALWDRARGGAALGGLTREAGVGAGVGAVGVEVGGTRTGGQGLGQLWSMAALADFTGRANHRTLLHGQARTT